MKNNSFAHFARAVFCTLCTHVQFPFHHVKRSVLHLCGDVSICGKYSIMFCYPWSLMTLNNWEMIAETRSFIFSWRSRCSRRRVCLSSLLIGSGTAKKAQNYKTREKLFPGNAKRVTYRNLTQRESLLFQWQKTIKMLLISLINFWFVVSGDKM